MIKPARSFALVVAAVLALTACSSTTGKKAAQSQLGAIQSAVAQGQSAVAQGSNASDSTASSDSATSSDSTTSSDGAASDSSTSDDSSTSSSSGSATDPATVDVCALLSPADGNSIAQAHGLGAFAATKDDRGIPGSSACQFTFAGAGKSVIMEVRAGSYIAEYTLDPKVNGLGDEAYDDGTSPAMRVGDLLVTAEMDSLSDAVTLDLLRKMAPNLK